MIIMDVLAHPYILRCKRLGINPREIKAQLQGEFDQKVFYYVYLPGLIEKHNLLSDVIKSIVTEGYGIFRAIRTKEPK
jgi:hypothetical protein